MDSDTKNRLLVAKGKEGWGLGEKGEEIKEYRLEVRQ